MNNFIIYRAYNRKGKSYVGYTSRSLHQRRVGHYSKSTNKSNYLFHNAIRYGIFCWEVLEETDTLEKALSIETKWIKIYNSFMPDGYNMTLGGEGTIGIKRSDQYIELLRKRMKNYVDDSNSGVSKHIESQKIKVIRNDGLVFESLSEAARQTNVAVEAIYNIVIGRNKTVSGYTFSAYENDYLIKLQKETREKRESYTPKKRIVDQHGVEYNSLTEASQATGAQIGNISKVLSGHRKNTLGLIFKFLEKTDERTSNET
jgi:predicted GIY-YIG superfamily endonuclease